VKSLIKNLLRGLFTIIGLVLGYVIGGTMKNIGYFSNFMTNNSMVHVLLFYVFCSLFVGLIVFLVSPWIIKGIFWSMEYFEKSMQKIPVLEIIFGTVGAIVGLLICATFIMMFQTSSTLLGKVIGLTICVIVAVFTGDIAVKKREEIRALFVSIKKSSSIKDKKGKIVSKATPKILDTSVIIDGRIFDICQTGFIEGTLVIPTFVLGELRHIADSADGLKRNRGRRGLDILNKIQKELNIEVEIYEKDFPNIHEVDIKLLKLAEVLNGKVITNDYNLNKVAEFQGVPVLNINEMANAVKPVVLPGEEMHIDIIKDGKESGQGVAYLDDGTMIVVEGGRKHIGETLDVVVTSVLQTAAGRMIFAKQKDNNDREH
jgi:uncharacterized protein YacL